MILNVLFIVVDLLVMLAYPLVIMHGKLRQFSSSKESNPMANVFIVGSVTPGR